MLFPGLLKKIESITMEKGRIVVSSFDGLFADKNAEISGI